MYTATHDAVARVLSEAFGKTGGRAPRAWYLQPEVREPGLTGAALDAAIDRIAASHPTRVRTSVRTKAN